MENIYWSGPRESDIAYTSNMFKGSVTFYGSNANENSAFCGNSEVRINHNIYNKDVSDYILEWQLNRIQEDPDCLFMSYNPNCVYGAPDEILKRTICLNEESLMKKLDDKINFRKIAEGIVPTLPAVILSGDHCRYQELKSKFANFESFVIQAPHSSGGQGTFLMRLNNAVEVEALLHPHNYYVVTGYVESNIPVNLHAIIYEDDIVLFPGSVQIIQFGDNRLLYRGADYCTFQELDSQVKRRLYELSTDLLRKIQTMGYRGIAGIDAMIEGNQIFFMEINNRFQGSSVLLTKALFESKMPSLQKMNWDAFSGTKADPELLKNIRELRVPYSMYTYVNENNGQQARYILEAAHRESLVKEILYEGYRPDQPAESFASLFSLVFGGNISSITPNETKVRIHPNITVPSKQWMNRLLSGDLTALKIALMNRGAVLTDAAKNYVHENGDMREGTYFSLDLFLNGVYMNTPLSVKLTALSPFKIDVNANNRLVLLFFDQYVSEVDYDRKTDLKQELSAGTLPINQILFLATDRLRIQNNSYCTFAKHGVVCKFCEANGIDNAFSTQDILDSLDLLFQSQNRPTFRHVLVGGLSNDIGFEQEAILKICRKVREYSDMPIYLMCLPPRKEDVRRYYEAGVTEFGFNIEIFDRFIARQIMPGKGSIPLDRYYEALEEAVRWVGRDGAVRTAFLVGLEPLQSLLCGIEKVCRMGVAPILSPFRPIPGTEMEHLIPPSDEWLYEMTKRAENICESYGFSLGPVCPACRNNTLTIVKKNEVKEIYSSLWRRMDS